MTTVYEREPYKKARQKFDKIDARDERLRFSGLPVIGVLIISSILTPWPEAFLSGSLLIACAWFAFGFWQIHEHHLRRVHLNDLAYKLGNRRIALDLVHALEKIRDEYPDGLPRGDS